LTERDLHVVTGAFGYSGRYIARRLLARGHRVATLTNSPRRPHDLGADVTALPLAFGDPEALARSLAGARVLYNTYWVRFDHADFSHETAVRNTTALFEAARRAGVRRVVHVSITNPSEGSPLPYFRGKARLERALRDSGLAHSILRPAVLFGPEDILVNNIAWALRTFPLFGVFGRGDYRLRPIHVDDLAALAVENGEAGDDTVVDAVGPESFSYRELVQMLGRAIGRPRPVLSIPPWLGLAIGKVVGACKRDVLITREEVAGLMAGLLESSAPSTGSTSLVAWAEGHAASLGLRYASELRRRRERTVAYLVAPPA
jgi:NADH dehydrogenase